MNNKRDIHVQKINVQKIVFRYLSRSLRELIVYFHKLYIIGKASNSGPNPNPLKHSYVS